MNSCRTRRTRGRNRVGRSADAHPIRDEVRRATELELVVIERLREFAGLVPMANCGFCVADAGRAASDHDPNAVSAEIFDGFAEGDRFGQSVAIDVVGEGISPVASEMIVRTEITDRRATLDEALVPLV